MSRPQRDEAIETPPMAVLRATDLNNPELQEQRDLAIEQCERHHIQDLWSEAHRKHGSDNAVATAIGITRKMAERLRKRRQVSLKWEREFTLLRKAGVRPRDVSLSKLRDAEVSVLVNAMCEVRWVLIDRRSLPFSHQELDLIARLARTTRPSRSVLDNRVAWNRWLERHRDTAHQKSNAASGSSVHSPIELLAAAGDWVAAETVVEDWSHSEQEALDQRPPGLGVYAPEHVLLFARYFESIKEATRNPTRQMWMLDMTGYATDFSNWDSGDRLYTPLLQRNKEYSEAYMRGGLAGFGSHRTFMLRKGRLTRRGLNNLVSTCISHLDHLTQPRIVFQDEVKVPEYCLADIANLGLECVDFGDIEFSGMTDRGFLGGSCADGFCKPNSKIGKDILERVHWTAVDSNMSCVISCRDDVFRVYDHLSPFVK